MPGRIARGPSQKKPGAQTLRSRARNNSPVTDVPSEGPDSTLRRAVCVVFADAQKTTAAHRKAVISLRKIQEACCYEPVDRERHNTQKDDFEEESFNGEVMRCILRILAVRKVEPVGDRVVRFLGTFLNAASKQDQELVGSDDAETSGIMETPTSRLTTHILTTLLPLLSSKDKTIRFRATQITSHIVNSMDTLDDNLFHRLRLTLLKRIHDKETPVRLQAVYGLGRLAAEVDEDEAKDDSDSEEETGSGVLEKLLNVLQNDPSAEVRRNLLLNLPLNKDVLPYLLERARDADGSTRRALYARLLPALGDFRHLSLTHREKLLRWGLRDRDENVRKATARLFSERWIEDCAALPAADTDPSGNGEMDLKANSPAAAPSLDALLELLERIDVVNAGGEGGVAQMAMHEFWKGRPDYADYVSFPDSFWDELTPELAFVARTFNDYCRGPQSNPGPSLDTFLDEKLPEVTKFGFLLQKELQRLVEVIGQGAAGEDDAEEESVQREFVIEQMLQMALTFDYSDEVGRQKMFALMREALATPDMPEEATRLIVEVLRLVCGDGSRGEREFCGVVLEAIAEVHDTIMGDDTEREDSSTEESFHSATSQLDGDIIVVAQKPPAKTRGQVKEDDGEVDEQRAIKEIMVNMKCLHIALCMLQNVQCDLEENVHLVTMLNNLVIPAVRSQEAPIRERGLCCLGLCCLLAKDLASENLTLFLHCFAKGHPALQNIALQIIADILITHPSLITEVTQDMTVDPERQVNTNALAKQLIKAFSKSLKSEDPTVQATGATALAKVMLGRLVTDVDLLKQLVVVYFDPDTSSNAQMKQSLTYFLPVYCHCSSENAAHMASIAPSIIAKLSTIRDAYLEDADAASGGEESEGGVVKLNTIGQMLLDWTDPRKIIGFAEASGKGVVAERAGETHYLLAEHILERLVTSQVGKDEKKVLFSMLGKLHLPETGCNVERLKGVLELLAEVIDTRVASDATSRNTLNKLQTQLLKFINDHMTEERGGGGAEETAIESTEAPEQTVCDTEESQISAELPSAEEDMGQAQRTMRDSTIGAPDAEGTRINVGAHEDTEMLDTDMTDVF